MKHGCNTECRRGPTMGLGGSFALPVGRGSCRAVTLPCLIRGPAFRISLWHRSGTSAHLQARAAIGDSVEDGTAFCMTFLPIVERELRVAARRKNTFWTRMAVALVAVLIAGWALLSFGFVPIRVNAGH